MPGRATVKAETPGTIPYHHRPSHGVLPRSRTVRGTGTIRTIGNMQNPKTMTLSLRRRE
ncbi:Uncharacterized protein ToN1_47530 [Aromatoleum petrolei]|nr:Uncharacterized protein ToN1_47530 [Aromatoleum petrolei]